MKSWQDRGEVLDSDDEEELSLGLESQISDHVGEKARFGAEEPALDITGRSLSDDDTFEAPIDDGRSQRDESRRYNDASPSRRVGMGTAQPSAADTEKTEVDVQEGTEWVDLASQQPFWDARTSTPPRNRPQSHSQQSGSSEQLPDIRELLAQRTERASADDAALSSGLSSPLSERDLSPFAPASCKYPEASRDFSEHASAETPDVRDGLNSPNQPITVNQGAIEHVGGRSLRQRNEKQLHPYLFDKAQHQEQFRNYGMRPIRVVATHTANDPEEIESNNDGNSSDQSWLDATQQRQLVPSQHPATASGVGVSDDDLPELSVLLAQTADRSRMESVKRRKLTHVPVVMARTQDEFLIPPSPPPTSSDSHPHEKSKPSRACFRLPRGLTPEALLTPEITSALGHPFPADRRAQSPGPERQSSEVSSRDRAAPVVVTSSDESSQEERQREINERRLRKERKRIRGVLPASWLKIDFRAQNKQDQPSPIRIRRLSSASPPPTAPTKGVAQRVLSKRKPFASHVNAIGISGDSEEDEGEDRAPAPPRMRQPALVFERHRDTTAPSELVDDERMELDWVDPMLATGSRPRSRPQENRRRQPKITASFAKHANGNADLSEERRAMRRMVGTSSRSAGSGQRRVGHRIPARKRPSPMSILDASQRDGLGKHLPQFVRVAMRRARKQPDGGRHLPSGKLIRLASRADTAEARSVLSTWLDGTFTTTACPEKEDSTQMSSCWHAWQPSSARTPLSELPSNRQRKLPPPLGRRESDRTSASDPNVTRKMPRLRQRQLTPIILQDHESFEQERDSDQSAAPTANATEKQAKTRRLKVKTRPIRYRNAQLETLEDEFSRQHRAAAFEHRMSRLTDSITRAQPRSDTDFQLIRFLSGASSTAAAVHQAPSHADHTTPVVVDSRPAATLPHRPRKRLTRRVDAEAVDYRQPSEPLPDDFDSSGAVCEAAAIDDPVLLGLGAFGERYATDFDVLPLPLGTYFHESCFIGSGDFAASLHFAGRDLDSPTGRLRIHVAGNVLDWGVWTEDIAADLSRIPTAVSDALNTAVTDADYDADDETSELVLSNVDYLLRSTVRYFTRCLAFLDPIDRRACAQAFQRLLEDLTDVIEQLSLSERINSDLRARCLQYTVVLACQYHKLCGHSLVPTENEQSSRRMLLCALHRLGGQTSSTAFSELRKIYEENHRASKMESGLRDTDTAFCSVVILRHTASTLEDPQINIWTFLSPAFDLENSAFNMVSTFDKVWYNVFTVQPALEIDEYGILRPGSRFRGKQDDWNLPKRLIERLLELYPASISISGSTINEYIRATLTRCSVLINRWGWWRAESLLGSVFDFFARRNLLQLQNEESLSSPTFLSHLMDCPSFEVQLGDPSFHIFLKMLASALQGVKKHDIYADKKIGGIAWRFIPNHGRTYRKDAELRREDLDALRNHHDLLCTLYYAAPPVHRLRVNLIQNLVDHTVSHREICRLSIRAWSNLVNFQASRDEPLERLDPFKEWFQDIVTATVHQYRLARSEIEQEMTAAIARGKIGVPQSVVEDTIARNQRQISASLTDALVALKQALQSARSIDIALYLLETSCLPQVFDLFDPFSGRLHGTLHEALKVVITALDIYRKLSLRQDSQSESNESQDYGDSLALQQIAYEGTEVRSSESRLLDTLQRPLAQLLSNVFGADSVTDDAMLIDLLDAWIQVARLSVQCGGRTWSSYIHGYSSDAWSQLRDTEHRRRYSDYFLSRILDLGDVDLTEADILTEWLKSLVEREAILKFQHKLTSAVLNQHSSEPLLDNLPFTPTVSGRYEISMQDLRQRRLALVSAVLSNMRTSFDSTLRQRPNKLAEVRRRYASMLGNLLQAMKQHYQELQTARQADVADTQAQGAYVEFVQHVVTFLQQYSTDICPVDRFFTDSAVFPLPATDPTYVVGRLRSYIPKLCENRKRKELAVFVQAVSERAVIEGHHMYLVDQFVSAMSEDLEHGSVNSPSLRHVLFTSIFAAYVEQSLSTTCAWIIAVPILEACTRIASRLLYHVILEDEKSINAACNTVDAILQSALQPLAMVLVHRGQIYLPHVQRLLTAIFGFSASSLTLIDYSQRICGGDSVCAESLAYLYQTAGYLHDRLNSTLIEDEYPLDLPFDANAACPWPDTKDYVRKQIQEKFVNDWYAADGEYHVRRGPSSVAVVVDQYVDEQARLLGSLARFRMNYEAVVYRGGEDERTSTQPIERLMV